VEKIALEDEGVKAEIAKLQLPEGTVVISDPWIYGKPTRSAIKRRIY
jgi:primary-amine oxidase